jgi:D-aminoacyl-tRNA deacylase
MRCVIQRVSRAEVVINGDQSRSIGTGLLVLAGIEEADNGEDVEWLAGKVTRLRLFPDEKGVMNLSLQETGGELMVISQFTLHASTKKGNRPSYIRAARPDQAIPLYESFVTACESLLGRKVVTGEFGADMKIALLNDGPVTIIIDSKSRE